MELQAPGSEPFPIDESLLFKGSVIDAETVERIVGMRPTHPHYQFKVMALCTQISRMMRDSGERVVLRNDHGAVRILTDAEAVPYTYRQHNAGLRRMMNNHFRAMTIDRANLTDQQARQLDRNLEVQGRYVQSMRDVRESLRLNPPEALPSRLGPGRSGEDPMDDAG